MDVFEEMLVGEEDLMELNELLKLLYMTERIQIATVE